jgi:hypothetical protein
MPRHAAVGGLAAASILRTVLSGSRMRSQRARTWIGAVVGGVLVLAGCAGAPDAPEPSAALPPGVSVELAQLRADVASRQAEVHIANGSHAPLTVGEVRIDDQRLDGPAGRVMAGRVSTIPAGSAVDIRVQLPAVDCSAPSDGDAGVVLEIVGESSSTEVAASAPDPLGFLAELHARECLLERVTDAAALAFTGFEASAPGEPATLELTITPSGAGGVTIVGVARTNLIDFAGTGDAEVYPLGIEVAEGDSERIVAQIPIVPFRCDPHAVQEDQRGTIFDVPVEFAGESGEVELFVGEEMRGRILTWVGTWCGFGS